MRSLTATMFVSLDGVYQAPGGPTEDDSGGFAHGGWSVTYWDEIMGERMGAWMAPPFDLLLGRHTYEIFAAYWALVGPGHGEAVTAALLNAATKHVVSTTLDEVTWENSHLLGPDLVGEVQALKQADGPEIQVHGSGQLLQFLLANDLVDRLRLWTFPLMLGSGKRLFVDGTGTGALNLVDQVASTTGVVITTYEPAGPIQYGEFEPADSGQQ